MSRLDESIGRLRGMADSLKLNPKKDSHRMILALVDMVEELGEAVAQLGQAHVNLAQGYLDLSSYVDAVEEEVSDLAGVVIAEEEQAASGDASAEDAASTAGAAEEADDRRIEYECPHCGRTIEIAADAANLDEDACCPVCGELLFPELTEEDPENEDNDEDDDEEEETED